jgi:hypothetical protein
MPSAHSAMGLWEAFSRAVYKETVLVWALGLYGTCELQQAERDRRQLQQREALECQQSQGVTTVASCLSICSCAHRRDSTLCLRQEKEGGA